MGGKILACHVQAQENVPNRLMLVNTKETANQGHQPKDWAALLNSCLRPKCLSSYQLGLPDSVAHLMIQIS